MRRLPPFPELVAFEAVARHLSFTRAAAELHLTQSAVSHRVKRLETNFKTKLIRRLNPGLELTAAGTALLPQLAAALDTLAHLHQRRGRLLKVAAGTGLCTWWLAPRLAGFMAHRPGVSVELVPLNKPDPTLTDIDVGVHWVGHGQDLPNERQAPLFSEHVFPACNPELLPNGRPLRDAKLLATMPLLHKAADHAGEWSWDVWFKRLRIEPKRSTGGELHFADMAQLMSALVNGSGVGLVRSLLAHDALLDGRLTLAIAGVEPMVSSKKHVARWPADKVGDPDIDAFVRWLVTEAARTLAETDALIQQPGANVQAVVEVATS
jgi:LysR family transcriptional regulator, glycine cleavage system transcriptional activator